LWGIAGWGAGRNGGVRHSFTVTLRWFGRPNRFAMYGLPSRKNLTSCGQCRARVYFIGTVIAFGSHEAAQADTICVFQRPAKRFWLAMQAVQRIRGFLRNVVLKVVNALPIRIRRNRRYRPGHPSFCARSSEARTTRR